MHQKLVKIQKTKKQIDLVGMAKRKLSILQKAYKEFFLAMLDEYKVSSPAQLSKEQKSIFFIRIKTEWKVKKVIGAKSNSQVS